MNKKDDSAHLRQEMIKDDIQYHDRKLGLGSKGAHEGWIKGEEDRASKGAVSAETREKMIAVAAYYLAEERGFAGQDPDEDWIRAEAQIDAMLYDRIGKH